MKTDMNFPLVFLESDVPLTKTYELVDGQIKKSPYPSAYLFTSYPEKITTIGDFEKHLKVHSALGHCILKGTITKPLVRESRKGSTSSADTTHWICLDFDGITTKHSIDQLLSMLGIGDVSYVLQWSASYKIPATETSLRCHVFMLLDKPSDPGQLRQWLIGLNLNTPLLRQTTKLAANNCTLKWGLDVTACQNDKLLYIAEPNLIGIPNPFSKGKTRISLVKKAKTVLTLPAPNPGAGSMQAAQQLRVEELRALHNLPTRKPATYKPMPGASQLVVTNPDAVDSYVTKTEREFVYFNFNGGDSWGYFHHINNADVIYNFKGEDPSLTSKLLPTYYLEAKERAKEAAKDYAASMNIGVHAVKDRYMLAFQDKTGTYWVGSYDEDNDTLVLNKKKSEKQVRDFCAQNAMPIGDFVPEWSIVFDPQSNVRVDADNRTINMYQPSRYMVEPLKKVIACPPLILKVIHHALGSDPEITDHFMNWLAFIVQKRERTGTAWVLYGTEGTGKGVLYTNILKPLLGPPQCTQNRVEEMLKGFNGFIKNKLVVAFDEVQIGAMKEQDEVLGRLRNMITEETVSIRDLYSSPETHPNLANYLFFSNKRDVVLINTTDRRYNVGRYQSTKLEDKHKEFARDFQNVAKLIESELQNFAFYLRGFLLVESAAHNPLNTNDRQSLIATTTSAADTIAAHIGMDTANMQALLDELPSDERKVLHADRERMRDYKQVLIDNMLRTMARINSAKRQKDEPNGVMSRDEARIIFEFAVGSMKDGSTRFSQYLRHRHLEPIKVWIEGKSVTGLKQNWTDADKFPEYLKTYGYKEKT